MGAGAGGMGTGSFVSVRQTTSTVVRGLGCAIFPVCLSVCLSVNLCTNTQQTCWYCDCGLCHCGTMWHGVVFLCYIYYYKLSEL